MYTIGDRVKIGHFYGEIIETGFNYEVNEVIYKIRKQAGNGEYFYGWHLHSSVRGE